MGDLLNRSIIENLIVLSDGDVARPGQGNSLCFNKVVISEELFKYPLGGLRCLAFDEKRGSVHWAVWRKADDIDSSIWSFLCGT